VKFAKTLGILDALMPITHSCTQQSLSRCNECYWCKERKMAFDIADLNDTGKI
jgi:7-cyano-7-deazaguanine synthase in queuosine biosynthesis